MSIYVQRNFDQPESAKEYRFSGLLIDFLQEHFPQGFGEYEAAISLNGELLAVEDYDAEVLLADHVVILLLPGAGTFWTAVIKTVLLQLAASLISYWLMPKPKSNKDKRGNFLTISSQQNVPRLGEPIPVQYGRVVSYPPVAAQPYVQTDAVKNLQYLHQILCLGQGDFDVEKIELGNTDIANFAPGDVEAHIVPYSLHKGQMGYIQSTHGIYENLFTNYEVQGITMEPVGDTEWLCRLAAVLNNCNSKFEIPPWWANTTNQRYLMRYRGNDGYPVREVLASFGAAGTKTTTAFTVTPLPVPGAVPDRDWVSLTLIADDDGWRGWFGACMPLQTVNKIELDFYFAGGLRFTDSDGDNSPQKVRIDVEYRPVDDYDNPTGSVVSAFIIIQKNTSTPFVYSHSITVPTGRYEVRCRRATRSAKSYNEQSQFVWSNLRGYVVDAPARPAYGKVTLLAIKLRASARVVEAARDRIRVTATRRLPTVQTNFASLAATVNPIDAVCDIMKAEYGGRFSNTYLDIPALAAASVKFAGTAGFNYIFDQQTTVWDALQVALQAHRAQPVGYDQKLTVRLTELPAASKALFSSENYIEGSFKMNYTMGDALQIDGVEVAYADPLTWDVRTVKWPATAVVPERMEALGVSYRDHALAHAKWAWSIKSKVRKTLEFQTELDAGVLDVGDKIEVASPFVTYTTTGRVMLQAGNTLTIDQYVLAGTYHVMLRDPLGAPHGPYLVTHTGGTQFTLPSLPFTPSLPLDGVEPTHVVFGAVNEATRPYIVQAVSASGLVTDVGASEYLEEVYTGYPIPGAPTPPLPPAGPVVRSADLNIPELALGGAVVTRNVYQLIGGYVADYNSGSPTNWGDWITPNYPNIGLDWKVRNTVLQGTFFNQSAWNGIQRPFNQGSVIGAAMSIQQTTVGYTLGKVKTEIFDPAGVKQGEFIINIPVRRTS